MKIIFKCCFFLTFNICNIFSQSSFDTTANELSKGFYLRTITYGHVRTYDKTDHPKSLKIFKNQGDTLIKRYTPYENESYVFIRFEKPEKIGIKKNKNIYIGKLFYSERLINSQFNKQFKNSARYNIDSIINYKEGFTMGYKLFIPSETKGEKIYINIYPEYIMNVCTKNFHKDSKAACLKLEEHKAKIFDAIKIDDYDYKELNPFSNSIKNKNSQINYSKYIKTFWLEDTNTINLLYTKYADSYDRIDNINYTFDRIKYEIPEEKKEIAERYPVENAVKDTNNTVINITAGWIYAGKVNENNNELKWIGNDSLIVSNTKITKSNIVGLKAKTIDNIYLRKTDPKKSGDKYTKGSIIGVMDINKEFKILDYELIPSIDGNKLLWINIKY